MNILSILVNKWLKKKLKTKLKNVNYDITGAKKEGSVIINNHKYQQNATKGFRKNAVVNRAISLIANNISSLPLSIKICDEDGAYKDLCVNSEIHKIIENPNSLMSKKKLLSSLISHLMIGGNAYLLLLKSNDKKPEIMLLRPDRVQIKYEGNVKYAFYSINSKQYKINMSNSMNFLHIKLFNPLDDIYGESPLESAKLSIDQHNLCSDWNKNLLLNGARPSGAIVVKNNNGDAYLTDEQFDNLKNEINGQIGSDNAGKVMVLEGGMEWQEMSLSPKDMDFNEMKNTSAREIALSMGIPSQLLGIKGESTYNNMMEARAAMWEESLMPTAKLISSELSNWISRNFKRKIKITFDFSGITALSLKKYQLWKVIDECHFLTLNEKREIFGFEKIREKIEENNKTA